MRLLGTLSDANKAREFSYFLLREGLGNHVEAQGEGTGKPEYLIWLHEEDQFDQALYWMEAFQQDSDNPMFYGHYRFLKEHDSVAQEAPITIQAPRRVRPSPASTGPITMAILMACCLIFGYMALNPGNPFQGAFATLSFDLTRHDVLLGELLEKYGTGKGGKVQLPQEGQALYAQVQQVPEWHGLYDYALWVCGAAQKPAPAPLFEKISQGEVWRLFTPCLLHGNLLHIFFNMMWLFLLGPMVEMRVGALKYLALSLGVGVISNLSQYLMSGPDFVGYSGVIAGLAGFIWMRQKISPWESYMVHPSTFRFLAFIILMMMGIEVVAFVAKVVAHTSMEVGVANTAHISGALAGMLLARSPWFAAK